MRRHPRTLTLLSMLICLVGVVQREALAQDSSTRNELWPEVDVYINLKPKLRLFLLGTTSKSVEDGEILKADAFVGNRFMYRPRPVLTLIGKYTIGGGGSNNAETVTGLVDLRFRKSLSFWVGYQYLHMNADQSTNVVGFNGSLRGLILGATLHK